MTSAEDPRLSLALALAERAGAEALARRGRLAVTLKAPGDRVTDADQAIQSRIIGEITAAFPGDGVIAEEGVSTAGGDGEFVWVVDPLDGTNNYALGIPCFAVSIAVLRSGDLHAGVVHDPNTALTSWAVVGRGAFAGGRALRLGAAPLGPGANVSFRAPVDPGLMPLIADWLGRYKVRGFGSVALHLVYAALGALAVVLDDRAALWDMAAGATILSEAGGVVTDLDGAPIFPLAAASRRGAVPFVAGNREAHRETIAARRARAPAVARAAPTGAADHTKR
jgi:myo-inositol-1(or 4)-monophosphatase